MLLFELPAGAGKANAKRKTLWIQHTPRIIRPGNKKTPWTEDTVHGVQLLFGR